MSILTLNYKFTVKKTYINYNHYEIHAISINIILSDKYYQLGLGAKLPSLYQDFVSYFLILLSIRFPYLKMIASKQFIILKYTGYKIISKC